MVRQSVFVTKGEQFFLNRMPVYVNRVEESFRLGIHSHDFYEICYVGEGSGFHFIGNHCFPVRKGDVTFIPIGVSHVFRPESNAPKRKLIVYNCLFTEEMLNNVRSLLPEVNSFPPADAAGVSLLRFQEERDEFGQLFTFLHEVFQSRRPGRELILYGGVLQLSGLLLSKTGVPADAATDSASSPVLSGSDDYYYHALALMERQFSGSLTLTEVASRVGISDRHLARLIRNRSGMTFVGLLQHIRIREACRLLKESSFKVSDIALQTGYQDIKFFNKLFKQKTGVTPRQYRNG